ncbi:hypothetical protein BJ741DRAFT_627208 [Chytriomyces cf. hyalinus JEL632]|nr:hypothetical protein BJ741DRAFT_627208 [Chytriomyces cf. hyalinus JEL632]
MRTASLASVCALLTALLLTISPVHARQNALYQPADVPAANPVQVGVTEKSDAAAAAADWDDFESFNTANHHNQQQDSQHDDDFDDEEDDDHKTLAEAIEDTIQPTFMQRAVAVAKQIVAMMTEYAYYVLGFLLVLVVANTVFLCFAMGYLTKEEHYIVRAIKFPSSSREKVWRAVTDFEAYPLWRRSVQRANLESTKTKEETTALLHVAKKTVFALNDKKYHVTELTQPSLVTFKTHPNYTPTKYAVPMVMPGAPVPENINQHIKEERAQQVEALKAQGIDATAHIPKHRPKNIHDLPTPPIFLPANVPWHTESWTFELEDAQKQSEVGGVVGTVVYVTYMGTYRSRVWRFLVSLVGFDTGVEQYLADLAHFLGETGAPTVKPVMGALPEME